jgi:nucleosome assembly protein 1-like 1
METDYEMGAIIKEKIIPDAVSWFTGEANEEESDDEDYDNDEEDDEVGPCTR